MAYIKLTLDHPLVDGESVTFKAPCDSTAISGLKVYYVTLAEDSETEQSQIFTFKDAHGNNLSDIGNLFTSGAYIKVILDTTNSAAYIQNADTNKYLEDKFTAHTHDASAIVSGILPVIRGGTGVDSLAALGAARIQTGSYVGTGKAGSSNPNSITFSFTPRLVVITEKEDNMKGMWVHNSLRMMVGSSDTNIASLSGNTLSWYDVNSGNILKQLNFNGRTYCWVAFG